MSLHDQAAMAFQQGRRPEAERLCGLILAAAPKDWLGHTILGLIRHDQGRHADGLAHLNTALEARPDDPTLLYNRGNAHFALGHSPAALTDYDRSVALNPGFAPAWNNRANALRALDRLPEAIASYGRVLNLDPGAAPIRQNRAELYWQMGRFGEALADVETILRQQPGNAEAWRMRAGLLRAFGRVDEALASHAEAAARAPDNAAVWMDWGTLLWLERNALAEAREKIARRRPGSGGALWAGLPHASEAAGLRLDRL